MQRKVLLAIGVILALFIGYSAYVFTTTKRFSPRDVTKYSKGDISLSIEYGRPYKKGRLIFGHPGSEAIEFYGEPWRTGANEATEIKTNKKIVFPEGELPAGTYSVYSIPGENEWTIAFNSKLNYWGADVIGSPFDAQLDVLRVTVPRLKSDSIIEQFTIDFQESEEQIQMMMLWDDIKISLPMEIVEN
jgi:hypothetical protein